MKLSLIHISLAAAKIDAGQADIVIAGGFESSSTAPKRAYNSNHPDYAEFGDEWYKVAKFMPGTHRQTAMLDGAELTAADEKISREEMNEWILRSHRLAKEARDKGVLKDVVVSVAAVSYTHLDVYKRQTIHRALCVCNRIV